jgi:hypothetical protein
MEGGKVAAQELGGNTGGGTRVVADERGEVAGVCAASVGRSLSVGEVDEEAGDERLDGSSLALLMGVAPMTARSATWLLPPIPVITLIQECRCQALVAGHWRRFL